jgi:superfamily I DNA/RNA helicase
MSEQLIFGPPGCGKTYTLMQILKRELEQGTEPQKIGFVSFSRKAIAEAKDRAASVLNLSDRDMPYFRTLHSMGFHWLGVKKEEVIGVYDLKQLSAKMGMAFDTRDLVSDDGVMQLSAKEGNKYLTMINRAAMRMVSLEQEYNDVGDYNIKWPLLKKLDAVYTAYKQETGKIDFTDMIKRMVEQGQGPSLDVLIVDEAQDLTPLQWEQVKILRDNAKRIWYAGDDDQAIFKYTGVDVEHMLGICKDVIVLDQSFRVPRAVHGLASKLAKRISKRQPKQWKPTEHEGSIHYHMSIDEIDMSLGSWTIMARTSTQLQKVAEDLRNQGILYTLNGRLSFDEESLKAMSIWRDLQGGELINSEEAIMLYKKLPKQGEGAAVKRGMSKTLETIDPMKPLTYQELFDNYGLLAALSTPPEEVLKLSKEEQQYLRAIRRRGRITTTPAVKLSTIHRMKGGEDENIVLFTDMGYLPFKTLQETPDDEHRVFYTAVTRTKENLHIVDTESRYRYPI